MALFESLKGAKYASQIILQSAQPLDARNVVDTYDDLQLLIDENGAYEGMSVYVKDEKKKYTLKDLPTADWSAESKLDAVFVTELPTSYANYTFDTDTAFTAVERCSAAITTDGTEKYLTVTSASNAGNKYGLAQLDFSGISENAASIVIEMDFRIPGGRWYIGLVDLSKHPGTSHTMTYDDTGVVFHHGTKDGGNYCINGANKYDVNFLNIWLTM
ncbi:MAG: hypothetical protein Q4G33_11550, partial [bacterium]|nr:hypothetical protein [bacterium]